MKLLDRVEDLPVMILTGPAGSGKSTLLSHWQQTTRLACCSLSLESGDNQDLVFLRKLIRAMAGLVPILGAQLDHHVTGPQPLPTQNILTQLRQLMAQQDGVHVLILDDFHTITNESLLVSIRNFIEHLPTSLRLLLSSRSSPSFPLAKWALAGRARVLPSDELSFNLEETRAFFDSSWTDDQVHHAWQLTEGWAAGLQLLAISGIDLTQANPIAAKATSIGNYLYQEVFDGLTPSLQNFLLATALVDQFTPQLAEVITEQPAVEAIISQLEAKQLFLIRIHESTHEYRYHHMFGDFLKHVAETRDPQKTSRIHKLAMKWFAEHERWERAFEHALQAKQFQAAVTFLEELAPQYLGSSAFPGFLAMAKNLPEPFKRNSPALCLHLATAEIMTYQWNPFQARIAQLESHLEKGQVPPLIRAGYHALQGNICRQMGHLKQAIDHCNKALEVWFAGPEGRRAEVLIVKGACEFFKADFPQSRQTLMACIRSCQKDDDTEVVYLGAKALLGDLDLLQGNTSKAERELKATIHEIEAEPKRFMIPMAAMVFVSYADLLLERHLLNKAKEALQKALPLANSGNLSGPILRILLCQCRVFRALGARNETEHALSQAFALLENANIQRWQQNLLYLEATMHWLHQDKLSQAQDSFAKISFPKEDEVAFTQPQWVQVALELEFRKKPDLSSHPFPKDFVQTLKSQQRELEWLRFQILHLQILVSEGQLAKAFLQLEACLFAAETHLFIRPILDGGKPVAQLLHQLFAFNARRNQKQKYAYSLGFLTNMYHYFQQEGLIQAGTQSMPENQSTLEPLTRRETEVLAHIATGASNAEITQKLHVSLATLKTHINRVYSKLEIKTRAQAILKAQALGLGSKK